MEGSGMVKKHERRKLISDKGKEYERVLLSIEE